MRTHGSKPGDFLSSPSPEAYLTSSTPHQVPSRASTPPSPCLSHPSPHLKPTSHLETPSPPPATASAALLSPALYSLPNPLHHQTSTRHSAAPLARHHHHPNVHRAVPSLLTGREPPTHPPTRSPAHPLTNPPARSRKRPIKPAPVPFLHGDGRAFPRPFSGFWGPGSGVGG